MLHITPTHKTKASLPLKNISSTGQSLPQLSTDSEHCTHQSKGTCFKQNLIATKVNPKSQ